MRARLFLIFFIVALFSITAVSQNPSNAAAPQETDMKVFGIQMAAPLSLPECSKLKGIGMYLGTQSQWCWEFSVGIPQSRTVTPTPSDGTLLIMFPAEDAPSLVSAAPLMVEMRHGTVVGISFRTSGVKDGPEVLKALTSKYGQPSSQQSREVQNAFGAKFEAVSASWRLPGLVIDFDSAPTRVDTGMVIIDLPSFRTERESAATKSAGKAL
jgi:hypothetical protein